MSEEHAAATPWRVRPLSTADVLTDALRLIRSDFWRMCGVIALLVVPANVAIALVIYLFMRHMGAIPGLQPEVALIGLAYYAMLLIGAASLWGLVVPFAQVALVRAISDRYLGRPVRIGAAYRWVIDHVWMVAGTVVLVGLIIGTATMFFLIPGVIAAFLLMLTIPVMVTEGRGGLYAVRRSVELVMANAGKMATLVVVAWGLSALVSSVPQLLLPQPDIQGAPETTADLFAYYNATALTTAISTALSGFTQAVIRTLRGSVYLLAYYDARCRAEGYDVEFEARRAGIWGALDETAVDEGAGAARA